MYGKTYKKERFAYKNRELFRNGQGGYGVQGQGKQSPLAQGRGLKQKNKETNTKETN